MEKYLPIADVASALAISQDTVRRHIKTGDFIAKKIGGLVRISEASVNAYLAQNEIEPYQPPIKAAKFHYIPGMKVV
jgi:excisionase family DNA binding protein